MIEKMKMVYVVSSVSKKVMFWFSDNPDAAISSCASAKCRPYTFGTTAIPPDTDTLTASPDMHTLPSSGLWLMMRPAGTVALTTYSTIVSVSP